MIAVNCDLCGSTESTLLMTRLDRFSGELFTYVSCQKCGLVYLNPRPSQADLPRYYPSGYESHIDPGGDEDTSYDWHTQQMLDDKLDYVEQYISNRGHLLDIGCGTGLFMDAARKRGWDVSGVELIPKAANIAIQKYHLDVSIGEIESVALQQDSFDLITMWDVLEHVVSPRAVLNRCSHLLKDSGILICSIPNLDSYDRKLFGEAWIGWDAPRHFNLYSEVTLSQLADQTGLVILQKECITSAKGAFSLSLETALPNGFCKEFVMKLSPFLLAVIYPYRKLSYLRNRAPVITYTFIKDRSGISE